MSTSELDSQVLVAPAGRPLRRRSRTLWRARRSLLSWVGAGIVLMLFAVVLFGPLVAPYPEVAEGGVNFAERLRPPSAQHWMGTDDAGRDVLSRVIFGARTSLVTGLMVVVLGSIAGIAIGLVSGYVGGIVTVVLMRVADVFLAIPAVALALAVSAVLRPSLPTTMLAISIVWWPWMARLVQAEVLALRGEAFVDASRSYGASHLHIILHDILPNVTSVVAVKATLDIGFAILLAAALGFLGVGVQPPTAEWGSMIATGRQYLPGSWWLSTFPGLAIFVSVLGFNLLGDTLRDVLDVKYEA